MAEALVFGFEGSGVKISVQAQINRALVTIKRRVLECFYIEFRICAIDNQYILHMCVFMLKCTVAMVKELHSFLKKMER